MPPPRPRKRNVHQVSRAELIEPALDQEEQKLFAEGVALFNNGEFWRAHEAWEGVWLRRSEESRLFYQGIIQAAAGYHLAVERPRIPGAIRNFEKSLEKLALFPSPFLGIDVIELMESMRGAIEVLRGSGAAGEKFPRKLVPVLKRGK